MPLGVTQSCCGTGELGCNVSPFPSNLLYFPSVQRVGCAAKTKDMSLHGCYRLLWDELFGFRHNPLPLACFWQDTYCCSYSGTFSMAFSIPCNMENTQAELPSAPALAQWLLSH